MCPTGEKNRLSVKNIKEGNQSLTAGTLQSCFHSSQILCKFQGKHVGIRLLYENKTKYKRFYNYIFYKYMIVYV